MATQIYTLYTPLVAIGSGVGTLTVTDTNDDFFEVPDAVSGGQSALINGLPVTINSVASALGPQVIIATVNGLTVEISVTPVRIVVESGFPDTVYIVYPELPPGAFVVSASLPLLFPDPTGLPVCLTVDTQVLTDQGPRNAGALHAGDLVNTLDDGLQPIRWVGRQALDFRDQPLLQKFCPIVIEPGALGDGMPETCLTVSPLHAILLCSPHAMLLFDEPEVFVAAKHLVNGTTIRVAQDCEEITYCHLLLDMHSVLTADGALVESLYLGDVAMSSIDAMARAEILALFPELRDRTNSGMMRARRLLREFEARVLIDRMWPRSNMRHRAAAR